MPVPSAPVPTRVLFNAGTGDFVVVFDKRLQPNPALNVLNWSATSGLATYWIGDSAAALHSRVVGSMILHTSGPLPGRLEYNPPPFDLVGRNGLAVAAFSLPWSPF